MNIFVINIYRLCIFKGRADSQILVMFVRAKCYIHIAYTMGIIAKKLKNVHLFYLDMLKSKFIYKKAIVHHTKIIYQYNECIYVIIHSCHI